MTLSFTPLQCASASPPSTARHVPVLCSEIIQHLAHRPHGRFVDGTLGRGGHTAALLEHLAPDAQILALDRDADAVRAGQQRFAHDPRVTCVHAAFDQLHTLLVAQQWPTVDGILLDLGVSSPQLDTPERGFSFQHDGPLDMRMDPSQGEPVSAWLQRADESTIARILWEYGEERFSRRIARALVEKRSLAPFTHTRHLAECIAHAIPSRERHKHPATRSFQALRIFINDELGQLQRVLPQAVAALSPQGRLAVMSFHSLEDRLVKRFFQQETQGPTLPLDLPVTGTATRGRLQKVAKISPSVHEIQQNPRARSALLRIAERLI